MTSVNDKKITYDHVFGFHPFDGEDQEDASITCDITGYAGDKGKGNHMWGQTGQATHIITNENGGRIMAYDIDTTCGQSGAAIRIQERVGGPWLCIGVHNNFSDDLKRNFGTVPTKETFLNYILPYYLEQKMLRTCLP